MSAAIAVAGPARIKKTIEVLANDKVIQKA
jgi:hypothetical protein